MSFFKKNISFFLILYLTIFILKPNSIIAQNGNKIDSLKQIVDNSKNDSIVMDTYNKLRRATAYSNQKASQQYTYKFLEYAKKYRELNKQKVSQAKKISRLKNIHHYKKLAKKRNLMIKQSPEM